MWFIHLKNQLPVFHVSEKLIIIFWLWFQNLKCVCFAPCRNSLRLLIRKFTCFASLSCTHIHIFIMMHNSHIFGISCIWIDKLCNLFDMWCTHLSHQLPLFHVSWKLMIIFWNVYVLLLLTIVCFYQLANILVLLLFCTHIHIFMMMHSSHI